MEMEVPIEVKNQPNTYSKKSKPKGWTKDDKFNLYQALRACGSGDITIINTMMPHKTKEEITQMIKYYKEIAVKHPTVSHRKTRKGMVNRLSRVPLAMWAKFLTESLNYTELQTETANALRLIAECENIPDPESTEDIDFRLIYSTIADAMEGKTLLNDHTLNHILETCIIETAYTSKSFILNSSLRNVIDSINLEDKEMSIFPRPTENHELSTLRHLASQRNYNPLNIHENFLKSSLYDSD